MSISAWRRSLLVVGVLGLAVTAGRWGTKDGEQNRRAKEAPHTMENRAERARAREAMGARGVEPSSRLNADAGERAGAARPLFAFVEPANAAALNAALPAPAREVHYVRVDRSVLAGKQSPFWKPAGQGRLEVPLPRGGALTVVIETSELLGPDRFTSFGRIEGRPTSRVVFGGSGEFLDASIEDPVLGAFALRTATTELAQFYRVDPAQVAACAGPRRPEAMPARAALDGTRAPSSAERLGGESIAAAAENAQRAEIHVLMVHTAAALSTLSGEERKRALDSGFLAAIAKVNAAFEASLIATRVKLVHVLETRFPEDGLPASTPPKELSWQDDALTALSSARDGAMDEVHAVRDAVGADIVCLALNRIDPASSGLSFLLANPDRFDNADYAFSVVQFSNLAGTNVVAHEFGHLLGCAHDRANAASGQGAYPFSYGYRFVGADGRWYHDIMAYAQERRAGPVAQELAYFSTPRVSLPAPINAPLGVAEGRPGESDTARTIERTAFVTASYRLQTQAAASPGVLVNVATRAFVGRDEQVLIGGFVVNGAREKRLLVRGAGPALREFGVTDALRDPVLRVFAGSERVAENDNWAPEIASAVTSTGAFPFAAGSADAGLVVTLPPGAYTAVLEGAGGETGAGLMEVYDVEVGGADRVVNLATRGYADNAGREMVGGFVVRGAAGETKRILVRVLGPTLSRAPFSLTGVLDDPVLQLRDAAGDLLVEGDDWSSDAEGGANAENDFKPVVTTRRERDIFATGLAPSNRREPCVLVDLPPGSYTVIVKPFEKRSANILEDQPPVPGVGVIEVYEVLR